MDEYRIWLSTEGVGDQWDELVDRFQNALEKDQRLLGPLVAGRIGTLDTVFMLETRSTEMAAMLGTEYFRAALNRAGLPELGITSILVRLAVEDDEDLLPLVGVGDIAALLDVSRQRVYQLIQRSDFPVPVGELARGQVWRRTDIRAWERAWKRQAGRPAGSGSTRRSSQQVTKKVTKVLKARKKTTRKQVPA